MRKVLFAAPIFLICLGVALGEEYRATIKKIDGDKITVLKKGETKEVVLTVVENVKVTKAKFKKKKVEAGEAIENGLKNELFSKGDTRVTIITNDDGKVTDIMVGGKKKKKNNN